MLRLKNAIKIGEGMERVCYLHPENQEKVVKISKNRTRGCKQNLFEYKTYTYLEKHHGQLDCISRCFGFSDTDLGPGLVCQCIRDYNGQISRTLLDTLVNPNEISPREIKQIVGDFCNRIIEDNIQLFDLNPKNIVVRIEQPGRYRAVSIDLKGRYAANEFIPLSTYIPILSRRKLQRRVDRLFTMIDSIIEAR